MTDFASLGIVIDSRSVPKAVSELNNLTAAGAKAESAVNKLGGSAGTAGPQIKSVTERAKELFYQTQLTGAQVVRMSSSIGNAGSSAVATAGSIARLSSAVSTVGTLIGVSLTGMIGGAVTALGAMALAHFNGADSAKAQEEAAKDLTDAINDLHAAAIQETQSAYAQARANIAAAESHRIRAVEARKAAIAELELAKGKAVGGNAVAGGPAYFSSFQSGSTSRAQSEVARLQKEIDRINGEIGKTDEAIRLRQGQMVNMRLEEALDKGAAATGKFNRTQDALNKQLREGAISLDEYAKKSLAAMQTREKEEEKAKKSDKARKERKKGLTDEQRAYQQAVKEAERYIDSLDLEIEKIGKTAAQIRQIEIARAKEAAPTAALKAKIDELNTAREKAMAIAEAEAKAKERKKNDAALLEPIKEELALLGLTGEARDRAALKLEYESKLAQQLAGDLNVSAEALQKWYDTSLQIIEGESALEREAVAARDLVDSLMLVAEHSQAVADIMGSAFGGVGDVFGGIIASIDDYRAQSAALAEQVKSKAISQENAEKKLATLQMKNTASAIAGVKSLFKEKSTAFKVMQAIEMAYAAWQAAETIASIVRDTAKTTSHVTQSGIRTTANTAEGGSKIFAELGPWAFPVVAAMVAVLAALGAKGGGGGGGGPNIPTAEDMQAGAGTGSVLGDAKAKSNSIANSLEIVASNTNKDLEYSNAMLAALRSIDTSIAKMAGTVAKQIQVSGSLFDTSALNLGTSGSGGFLGIGAKSTTRTLWDLGIDLQASSVADIIANGIAGNAYSVVQKVKKKSGFFGIGGGTKTTYSTTTSALDGDIASAIQEVILSLRDGLLSAADVIGLQGAEAILNSFNVSIGKISFKDMTGEQIEDQLNAIFSNIGDQMAGAVFPALKEMQLIGEGLFETFIRVAREYEVVDIALKSIGRTFGMTGIESVKLRDNLVQLFGGLEEFVEATNAFRDEFLSEADQIAPVQASVVAEMERLGLAAIDTREEFKAAVLGLDLTTQAGRDMYAALLAVAPAFDKVLDYFEQANKAQIDALEDQANRFNGFATSLRKYRDTLFETDKAQGNAYNLLRAKFIGIAGLAATGDATALGGLEGAGKDFLTASKNNASTLQQYLRDVALVARGVDEGIFAAETTADYAQLQLDALENATSILGTIAQNTAATAVALGATVTQPVPQPVGGTPAPADTGPTPTEQQIVQQNQTIINQNAQLIELMTTQAKILRQWDGDGMPEERVL